MPTGQWPHTPLLHTPPAPVHTLVRCPCCLSRVLSADAALRGGVENVNTRAWTDKNVRQKGGREEKRAYLSLITRTRIDILDTLAPSEENQAPPRASRPE